MRSASSPGGIGTTSTNPDAILSNCRTLGRAAAGRAAAAQAGGCRSGRPPSGRRAWSPAPAFGRDDEEQPIALDLAAHIQRTSAMLGQLFGDDIAVDIVVAPDVRAVLGRSSEIEQVIIEPHGHARRRDAGRCTLAIAARNGPTPTR